ncbi:MAG: phosphoribosyl transferase [Candidatus Yonathbacteria bacterium]|nr:phosphoribosyl transferase [Candidatus Yonathbacteria bacterium]
MIFKNRSEAGKKLAHLLEDMRGTNAIILALPRGGVIVAKELASALNLPLDIIVTRKIGAPGNDEYAIGAIDIDGEGVWSEFERAQVDRTWLAKKIESEKKEAERRWQKYRGTRSPFDLHGKTAIIVDDGIATGLTMRAAVAYAKRKGAQKVVVAVPVAAADSARNLKTEADVRILETPVFFSAVGEWYEEFPQTEDNEVISALAPTPMLA